MSTPLDRIMERINRRGDFRDPSTPRPLLSLAEFFDGNDRTGSIGCNLTPVAEPAEFHAILDRIETRSGVADVLIEITSLDDPREWPFTDSVWIITDVEPEQVAEWFPEELRPDECLRGWPEGVTFEPYEVPPGMSPILCWWD